MELYQIKTEHPVVGFCESRIGGRSENQDSYGYHDTPFGLLVVVCDGMGGGPAGKTASSMAVSEILAGVMESESDSTPKDVLQKAIQRANLALLDAVADNPDLSGMGTTCTALLLNEQSAIMAHVGDSRIYQLRRHGKVFRTFDHSLVFDLVKQKVITEEQARLSDQSNIITRALGMKPELEIDIEERPYKKGDRFLLCTDGIHGTMPEKELIALATQRGELGKVVDGIAAMVDENGKKNGSGHDNLTLVIVETKEKSKLKEKMKNKTTLILGLIAAALAIVCLLLNSCQNEDIDVDTFSIEKEDVLPGIDTVRIEGTYDFFKEAESMKINIGRDSTLSDAQSHSVVLTGKDYAVTVRNLHPSTTYYFRYSVNIGLPRDFLTPTKHFTTLQAQNYTVSVIAIPNESGTVNGGGTYQQGQQCSVSAIANEGYAFVNWTENDTVVALDSLYTFIVNANRTLTAHFESLVPDEYTISVSAHPSNGGSVTGGGTFQEGQSCTVRATANTGYTFVNWTENGSQVSSEANYTFTVNGDRSLVANFTAASYIISATVTPEGSGTITGAGGYENGQSCTLRATANTGYAFEKWTENGTQVSTNASYTFTVTSSRNLVAHFKVLDYTINVSAQPSNGGAVAGGGTYQYGQSCTVTATASSGYTFSCWKENSNVVSTDASYSFDVNGNRNLVASFVAELPTMYTIAVSANPSEGGLVTGGGTFQQGASCTVTATANSNYTFTNWTENGSMVSTNASYSFTVNGNRNLVANFIVQPQHYTISVSANPNNGGSVSGGGTYQQGQSCTVTATANNGFSFINWTEGSNVVSTTANYSFTVTENRTLVAHFIANQTWSNGVLPGTFSVSDMKQVHFSQGNLQYQASANVWRFADNQWDYIGEANSNISQTNSGWIDLFGWGTSGFNHGAVCYEPWSISQNDGGDYYAYGDPVSNLYDQTGQADWGYNAINNGGNTTNNWCTLSKQEWQYVLETRSTASGIRFAKAQVNNVNGIILLPDDWMVNIYHLNNPNDGGANYSSNIIPVSQWMALETFGVVFVPAAGYRDGVSVSSVGSDGYYWSSSVGSNCYGLCSYYANFNNDGLNSCNYGGRHYGLSVRLVHLDSNPQNYTITVSANPSNGGTVSGGGTYQQGQSCMVSATANSGYTFTNWTENGNVVSTNASYTFIVNGNRSLTAQFQQSSSPIYVSTEPANRNVILEEFTGRGCGYCPDAHRIANEIMANNPERVWAINIHAGGYAQTSYPNMITQDGNTIHGGFEISGYPTGVVNRSTSNGIDRGQWNSQANNQMSQASECNIAGIAVVNPQTRMVNITVEVYYTGNSAADQNFLTVAMLQDSILGSQSDYGNYNPTQWVGNQYVHMHILRDIVSESPWGDPVSPTTQGILITRTYQYQVPSIIGSPNGVEVDLDNIYFLAWVSGSFYGVPTRPILNACKLEKTTRH